MTCVYVIAAEGGPVKVGIAKNPQARLRDLGTGTPFRLRLAHVEDPGELVAAKVEKAAHALLSAARTHGEWFAVTVEEAHVAVLEAIDRLRFPGFESLAFPRQHGGFLPVHCKMARAGLGLSVRDLAERARVSTNTITRFEGGEVLKGRTLDAIRDVFTLAGVEFIPENGGGPGVRLRKAEKDGEL